MSAGETRVSGRPSGWGEFDPGGLAASFKTGLLSWLLFPVYVWQGIATRRRIERMRPPAGLASGFFGTDSIREAAVKLGQPRLDGCTLWVTLEPCAMCAGALVQSRISHVVYATKDPKGGCIESHLGIVSYLPFNHQVKISSGILEDQSSKMLSNFFSNLRTNKKLS